MAVPTENTQTEMNIFQKLAKIRKIAEVVRKSKKGFNYQYSDINEILAKVKGGMENYHVSLVPKIVPSTMEVDTRVLSATKPDKSGSTYEAKSTEYLFRSEMTFTWINDDNPEEFVEIPWVVVGSQADPSQAYGSAMTYCTRYFLLNYFQIAQDNDVDKFRSEKQRAASEEDSERLHEILKTLNLLIRTYISDNEDKKPDVRKFAERFAKDGKYMTITEPLLAAKMLRDFKEEFMGGEE